VWAELGAGARARYETFGATFAPLLPSEPHVHLNMIGTRSAARGRGHARTLLDYVHEHSVAHPRSCGVSLTTEVPANVPLYEHFGYAVTGRARVSDEIETWAFFRPDGS
jgi:ribosomal protein S18 acetylase RimI-like enzyme